MWAHQTHISSNRDRFCDRSEAVSVAFLALVLRLEVPSAEDFKRQCMGAIVLDCRLARAINSSAEVHSGVNTARPSWTPGSSGINADSRALKRSVTDSAPSAPAWTSTTAIMPVRSLPSRSDALSSGRTAAATVSKVIRAWESGPPAPIKTSPSPRLNRLARSTSSWMRRSNTDVSGSASTARGLESAERNFGQPRTERLDPRLYERRSTRSELPRPDEGQIGRGVGRNRDRHRELGRIVGCSVSCI